MRFKATIFQPYFNATVAVILVAWAVIGGVVHSTYLFPAVAGWLFILITISSFFITGLWKYRPNNEVLLFVGSYLSWFLLVPLVWLGISYGFINVYAVVINDCCENNSFLTESLWGGLWQIPESDIGAMLLLGLLLYSSVWLSAKLTRFKWMRYFSYAIAAISGAAFIFMGFLAFNEVLP